MENGPGKKYDLEERTFQFSKNSSLEFDISKLEFNYFFRRKLTRMHGKNSEIEPE